MHADISHRDRLLLTLDSREAALTKPLHHNLLHHRRSQWCLAFFGLVNVKHGAQGCTPAGSVLIPVDAVGRMLELVLLLDGHWAASALTYPLALLTHTGAQTLEAARSQLEWMSHALSRDFGTKRDNPFACRCDLRSLGSQSATQPGFHALQLIQHRRMCPNGLQRCYGKHSELGITK